VKLLTIFLLLFITLAVISSNSNAQSNHPKIDSLSRLYSKEQSDSVKASLMLQIGDMHDADSHRDSALACYKKAFALNEKIKDRGLRLNAGQKIAHMYNWMGNYPEALRLSLENLKFEEQVHDTDYIFFTKREIMWVYGNMGELDKELQLGKELDSFANSGYFKDPGKNQAIQPNGISQHFKHVC